MKKRAITLVVVASPGILVGAFFFFRATPSICTMMRDPSGGMSQVCTLGEPSIYQKLRIAQHRSFFPDDMCVINIETGALDCRSLSASGCDQSATTTDCSKIVTVPQSQDSYLSPAQMYTEVASTEQSGKFDEHLTIDNTLVEVRFCDKIYKTRQIFIDGVDMVQRIAQLASNDQMGKLPICNSIPNPIYTKGILETADVKSFKGSDLGLSGTTYLVFLASYRFDINPATGNMYWISAYDGSIGEPIGTLWATYKNDALKMSFAYPPGIHADPTQWGIGNGDAGRAFHASVRLPSGAVIYAYALTKDYSAPKDGPGVATEGFAVKDGKYYTIIRGSVADTPFVPDEVWKLADGSSVLVTYGKNFDAHADYPEAAAKAMINLPGPTFTGIGFVLSNMDNSGPHPATPDDLAIFKKIITSIKFIQ